MKFVLTIFVLFFSSAALTETYSCAYNFNDESRPVTFERSGENFVVIGVGENKMPIFFEDNEILVLSRVIVTEDISGVQTSIINKIKKNFRMTILFELVSDDQTSAIIEGKCLTFGN